MASRSATLADLRREHSHMLGGSAWLLAGTVVLAIGSFLFWLLVAQSAPAADVGQATALFSSTLFVCYLTSLGLPIAVIRYARDRTQGSATLFLWSLLFTVGSSLAGVLTFAAVVPASIRESLAGWPPGLAWLVVFLLAAGFAISVLVDVRLMALRRWSLVFWRSFLIATIRLPFLLWIPETDAALYVYVVAVGGFALTGLAFLWPLTQPGWLRLRPLPARARRALHFAGVSYLGQLAIQGPLFVVPFAVLVHVDAVENARFYLSWGVMVVVYGSIQVIGQALLVEGGRGGADPNRQAAVSMAVGLGLASVATLLSLGLGPLLAEMYGPDYGPVATLLPLLMAGTIPFAVTMTLLTHARIREHSRATIAVTLAFSAAVVVPSVLLAAGHGAIGAAWGWTIGNAVAAVLALLSTRLPERQGGEQMQEAAAATTPVAPVAE